MNVSMSIAATLRDSRRSRLAHPRRSDPGAHRRPDRPSRRRGGDADRLLHGLARPKRRFATPGPKPERRAHELIEPEIEAAPWDDQARPTTPLYREQIAYLFERSRFYRDKLGRAGFTSADVGRRARRNRRDCRSPRRTNCAARARADEPIGTHCTATRDEIVRIYSTSGTTGTPSYIPADRRRSRGLGAHLGAQLRARPASRAASRIVSTYNAGPFVAGAALDAFDAARPLPHSRRHGQHRPADGGGRAAEAERRRADAVLCAASRRMGGRSAASTSPASSVEAGDGGGRARRRRTGDARQARGGLGRQRHRGDGHRRHLGFAVGRMRGQGGHAFLRPRLRAFRADRSGERRADRRSRRRRGRAGADASRQPLRAVAALSHPRSRAARRRPLRLRAHRAARALHRAHRRHADRARRQRVSRPRCAKSSTNSRPR